MSDVPEKEPETGAPLPDPDAPTKRDILLHHVYLGIGIALAVFLLIIVFGKRLSILDYLGMRSLFSDKAGVYADCSKWENRNNPYCLPKEGKADREWKDLKRGKAMPFNLHD